MEFRLCESVTEIEWNTSETESDSYGHGICFHYKLFPHNLKVVQYWAFVACGDPTEGSELQKVQPVM